MADDTLTTVAVGVVAAGAVAVASGLFNRATNPTDTVPVTQQASEVAQAIRENVNPYDNPTNVTDPDTDVNDGLGGGESEGSGSTSPTVGGNDTVDVPDSPWTGGWSELTGYSPYGIGTRIGLQDDDAEDGDPLVGL